jgi:S-adenosylmethionine:tRNA ribosyltransferase-isomerase
MDIAVFDYDLPRQMIAQHPCEKREKSRLLALDRSSDRIRHGVFRDMIEMLTPRDTLVLNDTRVIPARVNGHRETGGRVEVLFLEDRGRGRWTALMQAKGKLRVREFLSFDGGTLRAEIINREPDGVYMLRFQEGDDVPAMMERVGETPLPMYIVRARPNHTIHHEDGERYQTVYARHAGSVAAPTSGLHFTEALLAEIERKGVEIVRVTLHVGLATFALVKVERVEDHKMHAERFSVTPEEADRLNGAKRDGRRIIAVGTTTTRLLEALAADGEIKPGEGSTHIFIYPGFRFKFVDALITNFHLPRSTLLMLVSAFAGREKILHTYEEAKREGYRFYSYGDAMFIF